MARRLGLDEHAPLDAPARAELPRVFGDGDHPTTRLAGRELEAALARRPGARVLDAGCGTGTLTARALQAGAAQVVAIDRETEAVAMTRARAPAARALCRDVREGLDELGRFDLVVANLALPELVACAPALASALAPVGVVIATGAPLVFARRAARALTDRGLAIVTRRALLGWCAFVAEPNVRPAADSVNR
jgi:ribosomal protein L11 methylase PrmA